MPQTAHPRNAHLSALDRYFEISLYLLLLTSVLALVSTGKLDLFTMLAVPAALVIKGIRWLRRLKPELSSRAATWIVAAYLLFFPADLWWLSRALAAGAQNPNMMAALLAAIHLMLFVMIIRLFSAQTTRDFLFLAMLAFSAMLCAAILTVGTAYLAFFFVFLFLAISTFVGLEMRRSAEAATLAPLDSGTAPARRLQRALGSASGAIALATLVVGTLIFFVIPRVSAGYLSRYNFQPALISGFSEDVDLGETGIIQKNSAVVMHIRVQGDPAAAQNVYWRGRILTKFDGRHWTSDLRALISQRLNPRTDVFDRILPNPDGWFPLDPGPAPPLRRASSLRYTVVLEPMATNSLFFAAEPASMRSASGDPASGIPSRRSFLIRDPTGSFFDPFHSFSREQYDAVSTLADNPAADLRGAPAVYPDEITAHNLQLPPLDPRIPALARTITAHAANPYDKAQAIAAYLRTRYAYTLDLSVLPPADPLANFLFVRRAGHCELFATAMTVMLRSLGIPARYISGFAPGEYNDVSGDFIIRASDAHSWVEAYFPGYGWIQFDPTPPSADQSAGLFARLGEYWDWFQLSWNEWVINYDFSHQFQLAQGVQHASRAWTEHWTDRIQSARSNATDWMLAWQARILRWPHRESLWMIFLAAIGAILIWQLAAPARKFWQLHAGGRGAITPHVATLHYQHMLDVLARRGFRKSPSQTPLEFASSTGLGEIAVPVTELTVLYQSARFGGASTNRQALKDLLARIRHAAHSGK